MAKKATLWATIKLKDDGFSSGVKNSASGLGVFKKNSDSATGSSKKMHRQNKNTESSFKSLAKTVTGVVSAYAGLRQLTNIGKDILNTGMDFEQGMAEVQAISGASNEEFEALKEKAKEMGATTKFSAIESAEALKYMGMAGWSSSQMIDGIAGIMNLAAASGEELGAVSDIVTDSLTAFGLKASESGYFADVLAVASSKSNTNVAMLGESFKNVAPVAGAMGYSFEDTTTALGIMANAGIKSSEAGTALRGVMTRLAKPTDDVSTALGALGISAANSDGSMKSLSELVPELQKKFSGLTEEQKGQYATMIAGKNALSGFLAIVNSSTTDWDMLSGAIANADGTAQNMADTMNNTVTGQFTLLKSQLEGVKIGIFDSLGSSQFKNVIAEASSGLAALTPTITNITVAFGNGLFNSLSSVKTILSALIDNWGWLSPIIAGVTGAVIAYNTAIGITNGLQKIVSLTTGLSAAQMGAMTVAELAHAAAAGVASVATTAFGAAMAFLTSPIFLVVAAIGAAIAIGVILYKNWDTVKSKAGELWSKIKEFFGKIRDFITGVWDKVGGIFEKLFGTKDAEVNATVNIRNSGGVVDVVPHAKGGILTRPTLLGVSGMTAHIGGEAGAEAILPLSQFWRNLEKYIRSSNSGQYNTNNNINIYVKSENADDEAIAKTIAKKVKAALNNM